MEIVWQQVPGCLEQQKDLFPVEHIVPWNARCWKALSVVEWCLSTVSMLYFWELVTYCCTFYIAECWWSLCLCCFLVGI